MSLANPEVTADSLKEIPFVVVFELFQTELTEGFADIVLPDTCYLEDASWVEGYAFNFNHAFGMDDWSFHIQQPVTEPLPGTRHITDVTMEILHRLGKTPNVNAFYNRFCEFDEKNRLLPDERVSQARLCDKVLMYFFGEQHGWEYFKEHGFIRWPKQVEEAYWRYFIDARHAVYLDYMVDVGERVSQITREAGIRIDLEQYTPLISWFPCTIHREPDPAYDFYCFSYRDILHTGSHTMEQPWLDEASRMNPYTYNITMNRATAEKKGLREGDIIEVESSSHRKVVGRLKPIEGQHPQVLGIAACSGHWAKGQPVARGKGTNFDVLLELDQEHLDPICTTIETCAKTRVRKIRRGPHG